MLPQPILVSMKEPIVERSNDCFYSFETSKIYSCKEFYSAISCYKIIAGIEGLPKIDLSAIAEEIGWVDVQKLSIDLGLKYYIGGNYDFENGVRKGILEYQSLNEKKYSGGDMVRAIEMAQEESWDEGGYLGLEHTPDEILKLLQQPKVYNVEYIQEENTIKVTKILS